MLRNKISSVQLTLFCAVLFFLAVGLVLFGSSQANAFTINEYAVPADFLGPKGITAGPDGNLWFIDYYSNIGRITTAGAVTEIPNPTSPIYFGQEITAGPDGNIWFTEYTTPDVPPLIGKIGRITTAGVITKYLVPNSQVTGITAGPDGNIWFIDPSSNVFGRITPAGVITEFPQVALGRVAGITAGPDDNLWVTLEASPNNIGRVTTTGLITGFSFEAPDVCICYFNDPVAITTGPDGNIWFAERSGNKIGRVTTDGLISKFMIPTADSTPEGITAGPDGNIWFTERNGNKIGRITPAGIITEFPVPTAGSEPIGITAGPDGNIWFTEWAGKIGQIVIAQPKAQIAGIIKFFDSSVSAGTLTGLGPTPTSAKGHLGALRNMLVAASDLIDSGQISGACQQLLDVYQRCDGQPQPPDFVTGQAAPQLASQIQSLRTNLGCQ